MSSKFLTNVALATLLLAMRVAGQQDGPQVVASVDVGSMVRARPTPAGLFLVPPLFIAIAQSESTTPANRGCFGSADHVVSVDRDLLLQLVNAPGVDIRVEGTRFWLSGAEAAVKTATARISALRAAMSDQVRVRVSLVGRAPAKSVMNAAETTAFLAESPPHFTAQGSGRTDWSFALRAGSEMPFVADYSVEVAQKMAASSPSIGYLQLGLSATVAAYALPGGRLMARVGGIYSELPEAMRASPAGDPLRFGEIQIPEPVTSGVSGAAVLENGGSFVVGGTASGGVWLMQATRDSTATADDLQPVSGLIRPSFEWSPVNAGSADDSYVGLFPSDEDGERMQPISSESLMALCASRFPEGEAGLTMTQGGLLIVKGSPAVKQSIQRSLPEFVQTLLRNCSVELRFGVVDAATAAKLAAGTTEDALVPSGRMIATAPAGERVRLFMCKERSFVSDAEVEIAQEAAILDPIVRVRIQGVVFDGVIDRDEAGVLGVSGRFSRLAETAAPAALPRLPGGAVLELPVGENCVLQSTVPSVNGMWKCFGMSTVKDGVFVVMVRGEG